jgi:DNA-binding beta-propeller fold protein YncE
MSRQESQPVHILTAVLLAANALAGSAAGQSREYQYLFTIGSSEGVNPRQKASGRWSKLLFGLPERASLINVPSGVAVDLKDRIFIADRGAATVHVLDLIEQTYKALRVGDKTAFLCPSGVAVDSAGRLYVADACSGLVFVFESDLTFARLLVKKGPERLLERPTSIVVAPDAKRVYVADPPRHRVVVLNQEGEVVQQLSRLGQGQVLATPVAVAVDAKRKELFVLDAERNRVEVFTLGGAHKDTLRFEPLRDLSAMAFDSERRLFFLGDPRYEAVHVFTENRSFVGSFGQSGSAVGESRAPSGLYVDFRGFVYLVDSLGSKVLVFGESPRLPSPQP